MRPPSGTGASAGLYLCLSSATLVWVSFPSLQPFTLQFCPGKRDPSPAPEFISPLFESLVSLRLDSPAPGLRLVTEEGDQPSWVRHPPQVQSSVEATLRDYKLPAATGTEWGQGQGTGDRSQERGSEKGSRKPRDVKPVCGSFQDVHCHHLHTDQGGDPFCNQSLVPKAETSEEQKGSVAVCGW